MVEMFKNGNLKTHMNSNKYKDLIYVKMNCGLVAERIYIVKIVMKQIYFELR
jgi:hypothetical protein